MLRYDGQGQEECNNQPTLNSGTGDIPNNFYMPNWCSNFLVVSGGTPENLSLIAEKFSDPLNDRVFESLIGRNPNFDEKDWYNHNCATYGTKWDINGDKHILNPIDDAGGFSVFFDTAWSPATPFALELSRMYGVDVRLEYEECGCDFAGWMTASNGELGEDVQMDYHEGKYATDSDAYMECEAEHLIEWAINDGLTEGEFVDKHLHFMGERDRENILQDFRDLQKTNP